MDRYVLDACALIALLQNEEGADRVAAVINAANEGVADVTMNKINLLEVYYNVYRSQGEAQAEVMYAAFQKRPVHINSETSDAIFKEAGRLKATYKVSLADSIALAQALALDAELLTADHHEFDVVEQNEKIKFLWIR